jgi:hypothetical protein
MEVNLTEERDKEKEVLLEKYGYLHKDEVIDRVKNEWIKQFGPLNRKLGEIDGMGYFISGFINSALNQKKK